MPSPSGNAAHALSSSPRRSPPHRSPRPARSSPSRFPLPFDAHAQHPPPSRDCAAHRWRRLAMQGSGAWDPGEQKASRADGRPEEGQARGQGRRSAELVAVGRGRRERSALRCRKRGASSGRGSATDLLSFVRRSSRASDRRPSFCALRSCEWREGGGGQRGSARARRASAQKEPDAPRPCSQCS